MDYAKGRYPTTANEAFESFARELARTISEKGGGTYNMEGCAVPFSEGYWVGGAHLRGELVDPTPEQFAEWLADRPYTGETFIGYWLDPESGKVCWDISTHTVSLAHALDLAEVRGERAVWDIFASTEIFV